MGVPTIKRERESYLLQTLQSLLDGLNEQEKHDVLIVVFIGEVCNGNLSFVFWVGEYCDTAKAYFFGHIIHYLLHNCLNHILVETK